MVEFRVVRDENAIRVELGTQMTAAEVPQLQALLKQEIDGGIRNVALDCSQVTFLDSFAVSLLLAVENSVRKADGSFRLIKVSPAIMTLFKGLGLIGRFGLEQAPKEEVNG